MFSRNPVFLTKMQQPSSAQWIRLGLRLLGLPPWLLLALLCLTSTGCRATAAVPTATVGPAPTFAPTAAIEPTAADVAVSLSPTATMPRILVPSPTAISTSIPTSLVMSSLPSPTPTATPATPVVATPTRTVDTLTLTLSATVSLEAAVAPTVVPTLEQRIGNYTLRIWTSNNPPTHLPKRGLLGTATLTNDDGRETIVMDAIASRPLPAADINGDGYPDLALETRSGGGNCCRSTVVYSLNDGPTQLLATRPRGFVGRKEEFVDLNQDGVYEFMMSDPIRGICYGQWAMVVLRHEPGRGYTGSSYLFADTYQEDLAQKLITAEQEPLSLCPAMSVAYDYFYLGLPEQAWTEFMRLYRGDQDRFDIYTSIMQDLPDGQFFAAPPPGLHTIADFTAAQASALNQLYQINDAGGTNQGDLHLLPDESHLQHQFLALNYEIKGETDQRYLGVERCFTPAQDWSQTPVISLAVRNPTAQPVSFFLQFGEGERCGNAPFPGEVWRTVVALPAYESRVLTLRLDSAATFARPSWSPQQEGQIDLTNVGYLAFGVENATPGQGALHISSIQRWP